MTSRSRYSFSELADYARRGGWSEEEIPQAVAIAMAESGGNPLALNDNPSTGDKSFGLMQINMIGGLGPERARQFGLSRYEDLYDPVKNFQAAKAIRDSQGWPAWSVYKSGRYKDYLPGAQQSLSAGGAAQAPQSNGLDLFSVDLGGSSAPAPSGAANPLAAAVDALVQQSLGEAAQKTWEPGRMALSMPAQRQVTEALKAQTGVINALFESDKPQAVAAAAPTAAPLQASATAGGELDIVTLGQELKKLGLQVREHPKFGGVGQHSPNSHHYAGNALDLTIQPGSPLLAGLPDSSWRDLTKQYGAKLKQAIPGAEIFHPGDDPVGGHDSHIHLALPGGRTQLTEDLMRLFNA
jgi:hypothetical protein